MTEVATTTMSVYGDLTFKTAADLTVAANIESVAQKTTDALVGISNGQSFSSGLRTLAIVPKLLTVAYAGSKGFPGSTAVLESMTSFQQLMTDSVVTANKSYSASLNILSKYPTVLKMLDRATTPAKLSALYTQIASSGNKATELVADCGRLVDQSTSICNLANQALRDVNTDEVTQVEQKNKLLLLKNETESLLAGSRVKSTSLDADVKKAEQAYADQLQASKDATGEAFNYTLIETFAKPIYQRALNFADKRLELKEDDATAAANREATANAQTAADKAGRKLQAKEAEFEQAKKSLETADDSVKKKLKEDLTAKEKEVAILRGLKEAADNALATAKAKSNPSSAGAAEGLAGLADDQRKAAKDFREQANKSLETARELSKELIAVNAKISESVELLKGLSAQKDFLQTSIAALGVAICALGKVVSAFQNTQLFWKSIEAMCKRLEENVADMKTNTQMDAEDFDLALDLFRDTLLNSQFDWVCVGIANYNAYLVLTDANNKSHNMLSNLPANSTEANDQIQASATQITAQLKEENTALATDLDKANAK